MKRLLVSNTNNKMSLLSSLQVCCKQSVILTNSVSAPSHHDCQEKMRGSRDHCGAEKDTFEHRKQRKHLLHKDANRTKHVTHIKGWSLSSPNRRTFQRACPQTWWTSITSTSITSSYADSVLTGGVELYSAIMLYAETPLSKPLLLDT